MTNRVESTSAHVERLVKKRFEAVLFDLKQTLKLCEEVVDPKCIVESQQTYIAKLRDAIAQMEKIKERPL